MCVQLLFFGGDVVCSNKTSVCMCVCVCIYIYMRQMCVCNDCVSVNVSASNQMQFLEKKEEGVLGVLLLSSAYFIL